MKPTSVQRRRVRRAGSEAGWAALKRFRVVFGAVRRHYGAIERDCGLGGAQLWALAEIARSPGSSVRELSAALAIHQATASNLIDRLSSLGLIRRARSGVDRRVAELFPSRKGEALLRRAPKPAIGILQDALMQMPATAVEELNRCLDQLIACMKIRSPAAAAATLLSQL